MSAARNIHELTATQTAAAVRSGDVSPVETVTAALDRIEERNGELNAFVHVCADRALARARELESRIRSGDDPGELAGVPFGVKDLEDVEGLPTTFGSLAFADNIAARTSIHVARLEAAGAIVVGKTNTPEFGYTGFTHNRIFGTTRNPWNLERTPGGSSGGSAAAIASRMVPLATASDGGGSIRIPACYVGAFGFKPTFGTVPIGLGDNLGMQRWVDTVHYGPLTRSVEDAALFLDITAGYHPEDPTSLPAPASSFRTSIADEIPPVRIGFSRDLGYASVDEQVLREVEAAVDVLRGLGHEVIDLDIELPDVGAAWAFLCGAENYGQLREHVAGREDRLGRAFWKGLEVSSTVSASQQADFQLQRGELNTRLARLFEDIEILATPTLPTEAFDARGPLPDAAGGRPFASPIHAVAFTYPFNFSGHPAATMRAGFTDAHLPVGLQLVGERHRDALVLGLSRAWEAERPAPEWP